MSPLRVLVVDNDDGRRELVRLAVEVLGHVAELASSHSEALQALTGPRAFDLVIVGLDPHLGVIELTRTITHWPSPKPPPVVVISAALDPHRRAMLLDAGAFDAVGRPPVIRLVEEILGRIPAQDAPPEMGRRS